MAQNPFLDPILARAKIAPSSTYATFCAAGAWQPVTWGALIERAGQFAAVYARSGVEAGDVVFIILRSGIDTHAAFLGAMFAGAIPSFLPYPNVKQDHQLYWSQHRKVFGHVQPRLIVAYDELAEAVRAAARGTGATVLAQVEIEAANAVPNLRGGDGEAIALLQHSSGTTGLKKGVALSYSAICRQLAAYRDALRLEQVARPVIISWLPLYHDMGLITSFLMPLWLGVPLVEIDPFEWVAKPALLLEGIERNRATHVWLPNFAFMHLVRTTPPRAKFDLSSVVALINCSEPCKPATFDAFVNRFGSSSVRMEALQTCYAMAETVFAATQSSVDRPVRRIEIDRSCIETLGSVRSAESADTALVLLSNGPPIAGCEIRVLRADAFVGEREIGELCVKAEYLFSGYFGNDAATKQAFHGDWYRTGDIGFLDQGEVFVSGRLKDVIIVNGRNVFAHDVEAAVARIQGLKPGRAIAFGFYLDAAGSEQLVVVAERDSTHPDIQDIIRSVNAAVIDEIGIPCGDIRVVEPGWLIKTTSGKISRSENARKYAETFRRAQLHNLRASHAK